MATVKVVYNATYGGFSLSTEALNLYNEKCSALNLPHASFRGRDIKRTDPLLIEVVEQLRENANGKCSDLKIVEIPIEYQDCYELTQYDGAEDVICHPPNLVNHKFKDLDVDNLDINECRDRLREIVNILNTEPEYREL